ncbi:mediator complex subunit MED14-domain-containing protein [Tribonema minus]|uniref:Mediator of RNA polymerase II transcription subunit 14 n=1 Tax=Tribonema minus TaxID=303371 RepID=A0A836CA29_9STRA|nr:mediator complex subunit MED14-domain-containing protein [Tribonema minus]
MNSTSQQQAGGPPPQDPIPSIPASYLVHLLVEKAYDDLQSLSSALSMENLDTRREEVLAYVRSYRARFLKAYAAVRWLTEFGHRELIADAREALAVAHGHRDKINEAQDRLFFMHGGLFGARQRPFDVPAALDVLGSGTYPRLPLGIPWCGMDQDESSLVPTDTPEQRASVLARVDRALRLALLVREPFPAGFTSRAVRRGCLYLEVAHEFELRLTLEGEGGDAPWVLRGLDIRVASRAGEAIAPPPVDLRQRVYLQNLLQRALDAAADSASPGGTAEAAAAAAAAAPAGPAAAAASGSDAAAADDSSKQFTSMRRRSSKAASAAAAMADASEVVPGRPLLTAYRLAHDFCMGAQLELLSVQAQALARPGAPWHGCLRAVLDRAARVLDIIVWEQEYGPALPTAAPPPPRGAPVNGVPPPAQGRFIRVHVQRPETADAEAHIRIQLGPGAAEAATEAALHIDAAALSASRLVRDAVRTFTRRKLAVLAPDVAAALRGAPAGGGGGGSGVRARLHAGGRALRVAARGGGALDIAADLRTGRCVVLSERAEARPDASGAHAALLEALALPPGAAGRAHAQGRAMLRARLMAALRMAALDAAEAAAACGLGLEPQWRWGALLGRGGASAYRTYLVVYSVYEPGAADLEQASLAAAPLANGQHDGIGAVGSLPHGAAALNGEAGGGGGGDGGSDGGSGGGVVWAQEPQSAAAPSGGEHLMFFLEVAVGEDLSAAQTMLVASVPKRGTTARWRTIATWRIPAEICGADAEAVAAAAASAGGSGGGGSGGNGGSGGGGDAGGVVNGRGIGAVLGKRSAHDMESCNGAAAEEEPLADGAEREQRSAVLRAMQRAADACVEQVPWCRLHRAAAACGLRLSPPPPTVTDVSYTWHQLLPQPPPPTAERIRPWLAGAWVRRDGPLSWCWRAQLADDAWAAEAPDAAVAAAAAAAPQPFCGADVALSDQLAPLAGLSVDAGSVRLRCAAHVPLRVQCRLLLDGLGDVRAALAPLAAQARSITTAAAASAASKCRILAVSEYHIALGGGGASGGAARNATAFVSHALCCVDVATAAAAAVGSGGLVLVLPPHTTPAVAWRARKTLAQTNSLQHLLAVLPHALGPPPPSAAGAPGAAAAAATSAALPPP